MLRAVIDTGSFAAAAEALHRSQSTISYAMARLREAIGVDLMRIEGRRAVLTEEGAALLAEATPLLDDLRRIERRASGAARGERLRIRLLVDTLFPRSRLLDAIEHFSSEQPYVSIDLRETVRQSVDDDGLPEHELGILIASPGTDEANIVARVDLVAVARHDHPLVASGRAPSPADLARHCRLEISGLEADASVETMNGRVWRMNTVEAAVDAVRRGLCYGWLPRPFIEDDLAEGRLRALALSDGAVRTYPLALSFPIGIEEQDRILVSFARMLRE